MITIVEVLLALAVMAAIGYPLFVKPSLAEGEVDEGDERHKLLSAKEAAFVALKDLEFDYKTGKIDEADYAALKSRYEAEAVKVMKRLDNAPKEQPAARAGEKARFCSDCGAKADAGDRFCASCGQPIKK
ncbi:MAG: zinc ribbon domain-containing protein [Nitrospinae bacterium]|nr:zinc ribbon domain-containing protein [Nitrospinota bacterium]